MQAKLMGLRSRVWKGVKWLAVGMASTSVIRLVSLAILARLLRPEDFGLMGMVTVIAGFTNSFTDMGFSSAIIQRRHSTRNELSSLYWFSMGVGSFLFALTVVLSPLISRFYDEPGLAPLIVLSALTFLIHPMGMQFKALLQKDFCFGRLTGIESGSVAVGAVVSVVLAMADFGVYSLVYGQLSQVTVEAVMLIVAGRRWLPCLHFAKSDLNGYLSFGTYITLDRAVNYVAQNVDYLIIGKFLGSTILGYYTLAYQLISLPQQRISPAIARVAFPAFSKIKDDEPRIIRGYLESVSLLGLITLPLCAGMAVAARPMVLVFCGPMWEPSIALVQILSVIGFVKALGPLFTSMLLARGKAGMSFALNVLICTTNAFVCLLSFRYGIVTLAILLAAVNAIRYILTYGVFLRHLIGVSGLDYLRQLSPAFEGTVVMTLGLLALQRLMMHPLGLFQAPHEMLIWELCVGVLLYISIIYFRNPGLPAHLRKLLS